MNDIEKDIYAMIKSATCGECPGGNGCNDLECIERFLFQTVKIYKKILDGIEGHNKK